MYSEQFGKHHLLSIYPNQHFVQRIHLSLDFKVKFSSKKLTKGNNNVTMRLIHNNWFF